jgi:hypothetical protein
MGQGFPLDQAIAKSQEMELIQLSVVISKKEEPIN